MAELTPLQIAALGVFVERPMHPYEAYSLLASRRTDFVVKLKPGTLYHAIGRLADGGQLRVVGTERAGNRPERTTYEITDAGRDAFRTAIEDLVGTPRYEYPSFPLGLSELHNLSRDRAIELLLQRVTVLGDERDTLLHALDMCDERAVPRVYVLEVEYTAAQLTAEVDWLTALAERIASGSLPWHERPVDPATQQAVTDVACAHVSALLPIPGRPIQTTKPLPDGSTR